MARGAVRAAVASGTVVPYGVADASGCTGGAKSSASSFSADAVTAAGSRKNGGYFGS